MREIVLFIIKIDDQSARNHIFRSELVKTEGNADFYFLNPSEYYEYDPSKTYPILDPTVYEHSDVSVYGLPKSYILQEDTKEYIEVLLSEGVSQFALYHMLRMPPRYEKFIQRLGSKMGVPADVFYNRPFFPSNDRKDEIVAFSSVQRHIENLCSEDEVYLKKDQSGMRFKRG